MARTLAMFPGQGSQFVGMGRALLDAFPYVRTTFEEAEDAARIAIRKLCLDGPDDELKLTANTQPCILTVSVATWRVLVNEAGLSPAYFAGHSLGEYSAVVAAGKLTLGEAAMLVRRRGEAMQAAVPPGVGAMAAVMNLAGDDLKKRCAQKTKPGRVVEVVNFNSPQQLVVAGHKAAVEDLCQTLEADGIRFVMLQVSAPFHSSLMAPAREAMTILLEAARFVKTDAKIIANLTGQVETEYGPKQLIEQINSPVLWTQTLETASAAECDAYFEIGPGKVLFGLARKTLAKGPKLFHSEDAPKAIEDAKSLG